MNHVRCHSGLSSLEVQNFFRSKALEKIFLKSKKAKETIKYFSRKKLFFDRKQQGKFNANNLFLLSNLQIIR